MAIVIAEEERSVAGNADGPERRERSARAAIQIRDAGQRLQTSAMECQAMVDFSRAQVTDSRALLASLRREE